MTKKHINSKKKRWNIYNANFDSVGEMKIHHLMPVDRKWQAPFNGKIFSSNVKDWHRLPKKSKSVDIWFDNNEDKMNSLEKCRIKECEKSASQL